MQISQNHLFLWLASIFGALAILPYLSALVGTLVITPKLILIATIQAAVVYGLIVWGGVKASDSAGFKLVPQQPFVFISFVAGASTGVLLKIFDKYVFSLNPLLATQNFKIAIWKSFLASFYGGINEEILMRLFCVSVLTVLFYKKINLNKVFSTVISIIIVAVLFGLGHLPALYKIIENPTLNDILRILMLNGFAGIVLGSLYWRYGLLAAILSHWIADLVIHLI